MSARAAFTYSGIWQQARKALNQLRREIRAKEAELIRLKREEKALQQISRIRSVRAT
jgi:hypothetical protein